MTQEDVVEETLGAPAEEARASRSRRACAVVGRERVQALLKKPGGAGAPARTPARSTAPAFAEEEEELEGWACEDGCACPVEEAVLRTQGGTGKHIDGDPSEPVSVCQVT